VQFILRETGSKNLIPPPFSRTAEPDPGEGGQSFPAPSGLGWVRLIDGSFYPKIEMRSKLFLLLTLSLNILMIIIIVTQEE
jgi:hypothetical protein